MRSNALREYGIPFFYGFALVGVFFIAAHFSGNGRKLPPVAIILSPHFDDAVLSLGGFIATRSSPVVVVTFFSGTPREAMQGGWDARSGFANSDEAVLARTEENARALARTGAYPLNLRYVDFQYNPERDPASREKMGQSVKKDLETILRDFSGSENISLYGPAEFGGEITHPDHKLLHDTFTAVAQEHTPDTRVRFFFYEDFPYIARYRAGTTTPLKTFLEKRSGLTLQETPLVVEANTLDIKIKAIEAYTSQQKAFESLGENIASAAREYARGRCATLAPRPFGCEVVYEILHPKP